MIFGNYGFMQQRVNSFLAILLVAVLAFVTILYYFTHKAQVFADNVHANQQSYIEELYR